MKDLKLKLTKQEETALRYALDWAIDRALDAITEEHEHGFGVDDDLIDYLNALKVGERALTKAAQERDFDRNTERQIAEKEQKDLEWEAMRYRQIQGAEV